MRNSMEQAWETPCCLLEFAIQYLPFHSFVFEPFPGTGHSVFCLQRARPDLCLSHTPINSDFYTYVSTKTFSSNEYVFTNPPFASRKTLVALLNEKQLHFILILPMYALKNFSLFKTGTLRVIVLPKRIGYIHPLTGKMCKKATFDTCIFIYTYSILPFQTNVEYISTMPFFPNKPECTEFYSKH